MQILLALTLLLALVAAPATLNAQGTQAAAITADALSPAPHIIKQTSPIYPPIARAAHVSGQVKLQIAIGVDGRVTNSKVLSGPPMLVGAAQECVKQWIYRPGPASTTVTISFDLPAPINPKDEQIASQYFPVDQACIKAVSTNVDPSQQAATCKQAADIALAFSNQERFIERRSAFVYASTALRRNNQLEDALNYANKAVAVVEQGHDDGSGSSAAYGVRAQAEAGLGDLNAASNDLTRAEDFQRTAITKMNSMDPDFVKHAYIPVLKSLLSFHAQVLTALGDSANAQVKESEAATL